MVSESATEGAPPKTTSRPWMVGPRTLEQHTIPIISKAAASAGKKAPRIVASFPVVLTQDADAAMAELDRRISVYNYVPSYKTMLDLEGVDLACLLENSADKFLCIQSQAHPVTERIQNPWLLEVLQTRQPFGYANQIYRDVPSVGSIGFVPHSIPSNQQWFC